MDAWTSAICQVISVMVLAVSTIMKVPQILKIIQSGTTQGINLKSLLMEFWCFSILLAYPIANRYPLSSYVEFTVLTLQDLVLVLMVLNDRKLLDATSVAIIVAYLSVVLSMAMEWMPSAVLYILSSTVTPMSMSGKLLQIYSIVKSGDSGSVSPLSWGFGTTTAGARIFTNLVQSGDRFLIFMSSQACVLNGAICLSAILYKPDKAKQKQT